MWTALTLAIAHGTVLAAYVYWAITRIGAGAAAWPFIAALPALWLAVPFLVTVLSFAVAAVFSAERPAWAKLSWLRIWRLFRDEFVAIAGNTPRMMFYRALLPQPPPAPSERPILLVHGVLCNAGVWLSFKRRLDARKIGPVYTLSYGPPLASIELFADQAAQEIDTILAATGAKRVVVVAHSMGGLVMRAYMRRYGGAKISRLITLGTPHEGSAHAWMAFGTSLAQLRPRNEWLSALVAAANGDSSPPIVSLWSWHDSMVSPQTSSRINFGDNVVVAGVGHNALLSDPTVFELVKKEIEKVPAH